MRLGIISDVHGNLHALEAALAGLAREAIDGYLCAGDLVGYGPFPNECVELVSGLPALCVAGNHDLMALGSLDDEDAGGLARSTLYWTKQVLTDHTRGYLAELPRVLETDAVVMAHGSLDDPRTYVTSERQAREELERLAEARPAARLLILGHTHRPAVYEGRRGALLRGRSGWVDLDPEKRYMLNPGSVGQARERHPVARFMVLDLERGRAELRSLDYDVERCRESLRRRGLPEDACHRPPSVLRDRWAGRLARAARALVGVRG